MRLCGLEYTTNMGIFGSLSLDLSRVCAIPSSSEKMRVEGLAGALNEEFQFLVR